MLGLFGALVVAVVVLAIREIGIEHKWSEGTFFLAYIGAFTCGTIGLML